METSNIEVWNSHYLRPESKQSYPDESLVRLLRTLPSGPPQLDAQLSPESGGIKSREEKQTTGGKSSADGGPTDRGETGRHPDHRFALDFGCGSGRHIPLLLESGYTVNGCDSSKNAIEHCSSLYPAASFSVSKDFSVPTSGAPDGLYDVIVCWGVLHYMPTLEAKKLLSVLTRALRPDGFILGTLRKDSDTHFKHSAVSGSSIYLSSEQDLNLLLGEEFSNFEYGYMERTPLGKLDQIVAHWFFRARKNAA